MIAACRPCRLTYWDELEEEADEIARDFGDRPEIIEVAGVDCQYHTDERYSH